MTAATANETMANDHPNQFALLRWRRFDRVPLVTLCMSVFSIDLYFVSRGLRAPIAQAGQPAQVAPFAVHPERLRESVASLLA